MEKMATRKRGSIQISKQLAIDLVEASEKVNVLIETLEVQLDKQTLRRLRAGTKEYRAGQYKVTHTRTEIDNVLAH